ncbi:MAG TPA: hypothetical protein VIV15_07445, partial [Anaerolineales bacterium]
MRHLLILLFALAILPACAPSTRNPGVLPSPTLAILPTETSTPVPLAQILADFPLALGATWTYSGRISYEDPADPSKVLSWEGELIDKVTDRKSTPEGAIVFTVQEELEPKPPEQAWRQPGTFEYTVAGDGVYVGDRKIYQWPLEDNLMWEAFSTYGYEVFAQRIAEVNTPYGKLENCYALTLSTNPDTSLNTFCPGIGFVAYFYQHHGTLQDE